MQILIVEDDPQVTHYITLRLNKWGHTSESTSTGTEALQAITKTNYDLILLDIMLPDFKGYDLIPKFKKINPEVNIITMTGHNSRELERKVRKQGIIYYMVKPIETKNLKIILDHLDTSP